MIKKKYIVVFLLFFCLILVYYIERYEKGNFTKKITKINFDGVKKINKNLYLLSDKGSTRATAYGNISKIDFVDNNCIITWLGIHNDKFAPYLLSFDLDTNKFKEIFIFDESYDNHGVPSIVVDKNNKIHLFYYPHDIHSLKYRTGTFLKKELKWGFEKNIGGDNLTYPNAVLDSEGNVLVFVRKTVVIPGEDPLGTYGFFNIDNNSYTNLLTSKYKGYSAFSSRINTKKGIRMLVRFHEDSDNFFYGKRQSISYIFKNNKKNEWYNSLNKKINYSDNGFYNWEKFEFNNLINSNKTIPIKEGGGLFGNNLNVIGLVDVDQALNLFYVEESLNESKLIQAVYDSKKSSWKENELNLNIKEKRITAPTGNLQKVKNAIFICGVFQNKEVKKEKKYIAKWDDKSNSVFLMVKEKGVIKILKEFVSKEFAVWFPYLKIKNNKLFLIFTVGVAGDETNKEKIKTKVYMYFNDLERLLKSSYEKIEI